MTTVLIQRTGRAINRENLGLQGQLNIQCISLVSECPMGHFTQRRNSPWGKLLQLKIPMGKLLFLFSNLNNIWAVQLINFKICLNKTIKILKYLRFPVYCGNFSPWGKYPVDFFPRGMRNSPWGKLLQLKIPMGKLLFLFSNLNNIWAVQLINFKICLNKTIKILKYLRFPVYCGNFSPWGKYPVDFFPRGMRKIS